MQKVRRKIASGFNLSARRPVGRFISGRKTDTRARAVAVTRLSFLSLSLFIAGGESCHTRIVPDIYYSSPVLPVFVGRRKRNRARCVS